MAPPSPEIFLNPKFKSSDFKGGLILFQYAQQNSDLHRVLLDSDRIVTKTVIQFAKDALLMDAGPLSNFDILGDLIANHITTSMLTMVQWWLDSDMAYSPEEMSEHLYQLVISPVRNMLLQMSVNKP